MGLVRCSLCPASLSLRDFVWVRCRREAALLVLGLRPCVSRVLNLCSSGLWVFASLIGWFWSVVTVAACFWVVVPFIAVWARVLGEYRVGSAFPVAVSFSSAFPARSWAGGVVGFIDPDLLFV